VTLIPSQPKAKGALEEWSLAQCYDLAMFENILG